VTEGVSFWANRKRRNALVSATCAVVLLAAVVALFIAFRPGADDAQRMLPPPPTSTAVPPGVSLVAQVTGPQVAVYETPGAPAPIKTLENPWLLNGAADRPVPQVFLVEEQRQDGWAQVLLAERPNGSTGWVQQSDVDIVQVPYRVQVSLSAHEIKVFQGTSEIYRGQVAIGSPSTPTPTGKSYIRVLLETPNPTTAYGPYAYGLSGYSDVLTEFNGGDGEIGLHGNNDASVLGKSVTAGCIRMDNEQISKLAKMLPLGTPVEITS
jgi:lipoprotein-anchoring transpeptidase ErfK/SrfK